MVLGEEAEGVADFIFPGFGLAQIGFGFLAPTTTADAIIINAIRLLHEAGDRLALPPVMSNR